MRPSESEQANERASEGSNAGFQQAEDAENYLRSMLLEEIRLLDRVRSNDGGGRSIFRLIIRDWY